MRNFLGQMKHRCQILLGACAFLILQSLLPICDSVAQTWITAKNAKIEGQNDKEYAAPNRPVVFVGGEIIFDSQFPNQGRTNFGLDVVGVVNQSKGNKIYYLNNTTGAVELLFPIAGIHDTLIDAPISEGAVSDSLSIGSDGKTLWFAWSHKNDSTDSDFFSIYGADLYL